VLLRPRWLAGHALVLILATIFVALGFWQLHRNQEKHDKVRAARAAYAAPAPDLVQRATPADGRRTEATGTYDADHEVLLRNQIQNGNAGDGILTPLRLADGTAVLVDRGWLATTDAESSHRIPPPAGPVVVRGIVHPSRALSSQDAVRTTAGMMSVPRVDLTRIGAGLPYQLRPVWIEAQAQQPAPGTGQPLLPVPPPPDSVNHMQYAIQWFAFALIPLIGWPIVLWRTARRRPRAPAA
jgi:cytochrome oxidase assembly protein ShyY1